MFLLPYPDGKTFAFTIIDDTDGSTLEVVRCVYDYLLSLGLRTTKTVWVTKPKGASQDPRDSGDTLEDKEYAHYIQMLHRNGFEIALHNVSSGSNRRADILAGIEQFREFIGEYPKINVHHEKSRENLYFAFAQSGRHLANPFRTALFQGSYGLLSRMRRNGKAVPGSCGCTGEDSRSEYFWGDICRARINYVRSNIFLEDLNTLKGSPLMPYASAETPYVNYWFDSSNGDGATRFNAMLSDDNIARLRRERGCAVLYTHFGRGFVSLNSGAHEFNVETRQRLRAIAGYPDGWYVPVGELLDRLLAFQNVTESPLSGGLLIANHNSFDIRSITLRAAPGMAYWCLDGNVIRADSAGIMVMPSLPANGTAVVLPARVAASQRRWYEERGRGWMSDLEKIAGKVGQLLGRHA